LTASARCKERLPAAALATRMQLPSVLEDMGPAQRVEAKLDG
jgi:hypothetical protein